MPNEFDKLSEASSLGSPMAQAIIRQSTPHEVTDLCWRIHCVIHDVDEPANEHTYRVCGECFHVYQTEKDLVDEYNSEVYRLREAHPDDGPMIPTKESGEQIYHCPHCLHDF